MTSAAGGLGPGAFENGNLSPPRPTRGLIRVLLALGLLLAVLSSPPAKGAEPAEPWATLALPYFRDVDPAVAASNFGPVESLAEDRQGFIWIAGQVGLQRWDGYRLQPYFPGPGKSDGLPDAYIFKMFRDRNGRLWTGTTNGLALYDPDRDGFITYGAKQRDQDQEGLDVRAIEDDGRGGLWLGTPKGLVRFDPATGVSHAVPSPTGGVASLLLDHRGTLWIGAAQGLFRREPEPASSEAEVQPVAVDPAAPAVLALSEDAAGQIWIGTLSHGAHVLDPSTGEARAIKAENGPGDPSETVLSIVQASPTEVWYGTLAGGLVIVDRPSGRTRRIRGEEGVPGGLPGDRIPALIRDRAGQIWVSTHILGVRYALPGFRAATTLFNRPGHADGLTFERASAVLGTRDGRLWVGAGSGGEINILDPFRGRVGRLVRDPAHADQSLPADGVLAMAEAEDGSVYVGTRHGLYQVDSAATQARLVGLPGRDPQAAVGRLLIDDGLLWVGGPGGVWVGQPGAAAEARYAEALNQAKGRIPPSFRRGPGAELWIGTENGLGRLDLATGRIEWIRAAPEDPESLPSNVVTSVALDHHGRAWIGTLNAGIAVMTGRDAAGRPRFHRIAAPQGLPEGAITNLLTDDQGRVWVSKTRSMVVIDPDSWQVRIVNSGDGVNVPSSWIGAMTRCRSGELAFAVLGVTIIRPDKLTLSDYSPPVVISQLRIGGKPVPAGRFAAGLAGPPLILTSDDKSLAVEFSALDYAAPALNQYAYRLDGFDADWIASDSTRRLATYNNLAPGRYLLRLRGSNRNGVWAQTLDLPIRVLPAWYQTWWFRLFCLVAGIAAVALIIRVRTMQLRRAQRLLERQVFDRTAELSRSLDELHATKDQLVQQEKLAAMGQLTAGVAHEIQNPLNFVTNYAEISVELLDELMALTPRDDPNLAEVTGLLGENLATIRQHGQRAAGIVRSMLAHSRGAATARPAEPTDLNRVLQDALKAATGTSPSREHLAGTRVVWDLAEPAPRPVIAAQDITAVALNLIANAAYALNQRARTAEPGWIPTLTITTRVLPGLVEWAVADNGIGIAPADLPRLFTPFFTTKPTGEGAGLGLSLSWDTIVKRYRGTLEIESTPGTATRARVTLPLRG